MATITDVDKVRLKDSGVRELMDTGSQRDSREGKGRFDLLPWHVIWRDAKLYEAGAVKYDERNWEKGQKSSRYFDSACRHLAAYICGDRSEDHLSACRFNVAGIMFNEEMVRLGKYPSDIHDMPDYPTAPPEEDSHAQERQTAIEQRTENLCRKVGDIEEQYGEGDFIPEKGC